MSEAINEEIGVFKFPCDGCGKNRCNVKVTLGSRLILAYDHRYFLCEHSFCRVCMEEHFSATHNFQEQNEVGHEKMRLSRRVQHFSVKCLKATCNAISFGTFECTLCSETLPLDCKLLYFLIEHVLKF